jgi:hypothetical protein
MIATVQSETLTGAFTLPQAASLRIGSIDLIPEGRGVVLPPIVHFVTGFVKHLPHIRAGGSPPLQKRRTPAPGVQPYRLELCKVASREWIKKDYIIQEIPGPVILDTAIILYPYDSMDVFRDEFLYMVPIQ